MLGQHWRSLPLFDDRLLQQRDYAASDDGETSHHHNAFALLCFKRRSLYRLPCAYYHDLLGVLVPMRL